MIYQFSKIKPLQVKAPWVNRIPVQLNTQKRRRPVQVSWKKPLQWKLNTDGSCLSSGMAGGGVIVRNSEGEVKIAASFHFGQRTSIFAELHALYEGLKLCYQAGITNVEVELDSAMVVRWCEGTYRWPWEFYHVLFKIAALLPQVASTIHHVYRKANGAADYLANFASRHQQSHNFLDFPEELKRQIRLDQIGLPQIRLVPM